MGLKPQYGGWAIVGLVVALAIIVAGAVFTLCRRRLDWQWSRRNIWSICEEWRQRLSWLWAPREEKVGLVKAQHPTAQTVPGLYRQTTNASQNLLHSDSDLRLDAQGAFTRFEAVDRDLHPPLGNANAIPPQPLRPAPQPRPTSRPRPSPLNAPCGATGEYLRMHETGPAPLTPPPVPPVPRMHPGPIAARPTSGPGGPGPTSVFLFQQQSNDTLSATPADNTASIVKCYGNGTYKQNSVQSNSQRFDTRTTPSITESIQMTCYAMASKQSSETSRIPANFETRYETNNTEHDSRGIYTNSGTSRTNRDGAVYRQYEIMGQDSFGMRYAITRQGTDNIERDSTLDSSTHDLNEMNNLRHQITPRKESRGNQQASYDLHNGGNSTAHRTIMESIYGPQAMINRQFIHQNSQNWPNDGASDQWNSHDSSQNIEMTPYLKKSSSFNENESGGRMSCGNSTKALQRVSQYIESLPDLPASIYAENIEADEDVQMPTITRQNEEETIFRRIDDRMVDDDNQDESIDRRIDQITENSPVPPPPAPPDLSGDLVRQNSAPTTGERIFSALRSVTSQSYIDASEFYNSLRSSAQQQVPRFAFPTITRSSLSLEPESTHLRDDEVTSTFYSEADPDLAIGPDGTRRASDLYSPELNLEAHRTAQEVYNSLQDPPASPLLLRDLSQEPYPYMADPSFTRTSEDIFNSIEQRRKSMERLNGLHEAYIEMEAPDSTRRKSSQDLYAALEEVQLKRRLSQNVEDSYSGWIGGLEFGESASPINRRGSQGPEPEPPPDETNLKRAVSCESVCSDTSVNLGDLEDVTVVGHVCVGLEHERWGGRGADCEGDLAVSVLEARDLVAPDGRPAQDTLARVCLLPDRQTHVQTRLYRGSPSPSYQEKFLFPLDGGPIGRTLLVEIFSVEVSIGGGATQLGEASLKLGPAARPPATTWLPLVSPALPFPHLGELMFSLSYLPTAERLTLVVVKARNLRGANPPVPGDFFVKVYLLQQGKKMHKKKTSAKRGEKSPIFNEAIIFSVPPHALQTIQLRLTVAENDPGTNSKAFSVGHIIVGSTAAGKSLAHWRHMLAALRRPVVMWHPLRK